jgi:plasmid stabilization system protein ParE
MRLLYSGEAVADLVRLRHVIAENDPEAASRVAAELVSHIENLRQFPHIGIEVTQAPAPGVVRDMVFGRHIVRYAAQAESVVVLRIWHEKENER